MTVGNYAYICNDCRVAGYVSTPGYLSGIKSKHDDCSYEYWNIGKNGKEYRKFVKQVAKVARDYESSHWKDCPECGYSVSTSPTDPRVLVCPSCSWKRDTNND